MADKIFIPETKILPLTQRVVLFDTEKTGQKGLIASRTTEHYELSFFLSGTGLFYIDNHEYELRYGAVRFSRPGQVVWGKAPYCCCTVFFDLYLPGTLQETSANSEKVITSHIFDAFPDFFYTAGNQESVFKEILEQSYLDAPGSIFRENALLMSILSSYYFVVKRQKGRSPSVKKCVEYINLHYSENVTLEKLSEITNYSTLHIRRKFISEMGESPNKLLLSVRLTKAKKMLAETSMNIIDVASNCGFSSEAYFHTVFKSEFGITPGKYRDTMNQT